MGYPYPPNPQQPGGYPPPGGGYEYPPFPPGGSDSYLRGGNVRFGEAISLGFKHSFTYSGRASMTAYWFMYLAIWIPWIGVQVINRILAATLSGNAAMYSVLTLTAVLWLSYLALYVCTFLPLMARRMHDSDRSALWLFLFFIPVAGWIAIFVFTLLPGTRGPNRFG